MQWIAKPNNFKYLERIGKGDSQKGEAIGSAPFVHYHDRSCRLTSSPSFFRAKTISRLYSSYASRRTRPSLRSSPSWRSLSLRALGSFCANNAITAGVLNARFTAACETQINRRDNTLLPSMKQTQRRILCEQAESVAHESQTPHLNCHLHCTQFSSANLACIEGQNAMDTNH